MIYLLEDREKSPYLSRGSFEVPRRLGGPHFISTDGRVRGEVPWLCPRITNSRQVVQPTGEAINSAPVAIYLDKLAFAIFDQEAEINRLELFFYCAFCLSAFEG